MQGILLALHDRHRTGLGQHVDIALFDSILSVMRLPLGILLATGAAPTRVGNDHPSIAPYETLNTREGQIIVAVGNPRLWKQFCTAIERSELAGDPRFATNADRLVNRAALKAAIEDAFERFTMQELIDRLEEHRVPCGRVRTIVDAIADAQVEARDMIVTLHDPELGEVINLGTPVKPVADAGRDRVAAAAPRRAHRRGAERPRLSATARGREVMGRGGDRTKGEPRKHRSTEVWKSGGPQATPRAFRYCRSPCFSASVARLWKQERLTEEKS